MDHISLKSIKNRIIRVLSEEEDMTNWDCLGLREDLYFEGI